MKKSASVVHLDPVQLRADAACARLAAHARAAKAVLSAALGRKTVRSLLAYPVHGIPTAGIFQTIFKKGLAK